MPAPLPTTAHAEGAPGPTETWKERDAIQILIVDDESINHQVLRQHLRKPQFKVHSAMNGQEALAQVAEKGGQIDLILLDIMMPRMSGYEVAKQIRQTYLPSELPIIMVTAKNQVSDLVQGLSTGANDYLAKPFTKDEFLARLRTHLNLREINHVTSRFVPTEFIRALGRNDITEVSLGDHTNREVSIMFADIRGYTSLSEQMSPEETFNFVKAYSGRMGPIFQRNGGFVNQYLGDGIMAIFQQGPPDAVQAAIDMQQSIRAYNLGRQAKQRQPIKVGIGVHVGPLIMGIIGDADRTDPTIIADTVNIASRLEGLTKYYGVNILVSDTCFEALDEGQKEACRYLGLVQVKGRKAPMGIYECFAGDEATMAGKKRQSQAAFATALTNYLNEEFTQAMHDFAMIVKQHPQDLVSARFMSKAEHYAQEGVPTDWKGVDSMTAK